MGFLLLMFVGWLCVVSLATAGFVWSLRHPKRKTYAVALGRGDAGEPADLGLVSEAVRFDFGKAGMTDGWMIEGGGKESDPTVVMVHGYGDSRYGLLNWAKVLCELAVARRVVVYDQRGQGESEGKKCDIGVNEPGDVLRVIEQMDGNDAGDVVIYGCSMGGGTALAAAGKMCEDEKMGKRLKGVVVDGAYRFWDEPVRNVMRLKKYPCWPIVPVGGAILNMQLGGGLFKIDRVADAERVKCPLLVMHGTNDRVCNYESAQQIVEAAADAELISFEGAGHLELAEVDPSRYAQGLRQFFARIQGDKHE